MYLAELHGKLSREQENQEDILTSNVFSFFKYADRKVFLYSFLKYLGLNITVDEAKNTGFIFWPSFDDHTEPDLVLIVGSYYLLIEAKYRSGFGQGTDRLEHQIVREIKGGKSEADTLKKEFKIVAITAHYSDKTELLLDIPEEFRSDVLWVNWQAIAVLIYQNLGNQQLAPETRLFANDLYELLVRKNLRTYAGVSLLPVFHNPIPSNFGELFFDAKTASYRGDFIGFRNTLLVHPVDVPDKLFFRPQHGFINILQEPIVVVPPAEPIFFWRN